MGVRDLQVCVYVAVFSAMPFSQGSCVLVFCWAVAENFAKNSDEIGDLLNFPPKDSSHGRWRNFPPDDPSVRLWRKIKFRHRGGRDTLVSNGELASGASSGKFRRVSGFESDHNQSNSNRKGPGGKFRRMGRRLKAL